MASATTTTAKVEAPEKTLADSPSTEAGQISSPEDNLTATVAKSAADAPPSSPGAAEKTDADGGGPVTDIQKKMKRAERFNVPVQLSEQEKRSSRAERFGMGAGPQGSEGLKRVEEQKKKARAERFGIAPSMTSTDEDAKKKARLARFSPVSKPDPEEEDKRKARTLRFSQTASSMKENDNGKGNTESKGAVLGKSGDGQ